MARKSSALAPMAALRHRSLRQGLIGGHRGWMAIGIVVWGARLLKRVLGRQEELIATERLQPGESITIEAVRPLTRRERKAAEQAS